MLSIIGLGRLLNFGAEALIHMLSRLCPKRDDDVYWGENGRPPARMPTAAREKFFRRRAVYRLLLIGAVGAGLFIFIPSAIFDRVERWTYWESVYFCTITLITIGFGDFVPGYDGKQTTHNSCLAILCAFPIIFFAYKLVLQSCHCTSGTNAMRHL